MDNNAAGATSRSHTVLKRHMAKRSHIQIGLQPRKRSPTSSPSASRSTMLSSYGLFVSRNGLADWQCRYSGCTQVRHRKPNGAFLRFCNIHRLRQNEHQRAFIQRCRRGEARRVSRARVMQTTGGWTNMELDCIFTFDVEANTVAVDRPFADFKTQGDASTEPPSALEELLLVPVGSIDDLLDYLPAPDS